MLEKFQISSWEGRLKIIDQFRDDRLRQLGKRLIAFFAPYLLTEQQKSDLSSFIKKRWMTLDNNANWTTVQTVKNDLAKMKDENLDAQYINDLQNFYTSYISQYDLNLGV